MGSLLITFILMVTAVSTHSEPLSAAGFLKIIKSYVEYDVKLLNISATSYNKVMEIVDQELPEKLFAPLFNQSRDIVMRIANRLSSAVHIDKTIPQKDVQLIEKQVGKIGAAIAKIFALQPVN